MKEDKTDFLCGEAASGAASSPLCRHVSDDTTVVEDRTVKVDCYPGKPLDEEARQIRLPGCELISVLGVGGMGCVYLGRQTHLNRLVAVKALKLDAANDAAQQAVLRNEAVTMGAINHPNVVACHDIIYSGNRIYMVMEYVPGFMSVRSLVKKYGPLPEGIVLQIVRDVLYGLSYVYEKGYIHRDVKPANILVYNEKNVFPRRIRDLFKSPDTRIKICDFGIAVKSTGRLETNESGHIQGSPNYIAPEQVASPENVDFRADMYALAGTAYFMLTGRPPFEFKDAEAMFEYKMDHDIPFPVIPRGMISSSFARVIAKMGKADADERYGSYAELRNRLEEIAPSVQKSSGFKKTRFWRVMSILLALCLAGGIYMFGKDYVVENYFREKFISLTSTMGYWQGDRTGWYIWNMPSSKGRIPVLMGDDMLGELKLVQQLNAGNTLELHMRRKRSGPVYMRLENGDNVLDITWSSDYKGLDSAFSASSGSGGNIVEGIKPEDDDGWYKVQFKLYNRNLMAFVNGEPVYAGYVNGKLPFRFSLNASGSGRILLKNVFFAPNED